MPHESQGNNHVKVVIYVFLVIAAIIMLRNAWVCDDAYISFRTVDNFVNGYGLTWNTDERVQSFTNPLWVIFMSGFYYFTNDIYYTSIFVSIILTLLVMLLVSVRISKSPWGAILAILLLISSKSFVDYSTSGLETPLNYLILAWFYFVLITDKVNNRTFFVLCLLASLGALNRMDTILLYIPALLYVFVRLRSLRAVYIGIAGFLPFILWEIFSIIYYGFPFPNTYYAKLHSGVPMGERMIQAFMYYLDSLNVDPLTLIVIFAGTGIAFILKDRKDIFLALGMILYLLYIVRIGGDFMSGRFFAVPFLAAVMLISRYSFSDGWITRLAPFAVVLLLIGISPRSPLFSDKTYGTHGEGGIDEKGIADERAWYYQGVGLLKDARCTEMPAHTFADRGKQLRLEGKPFRLQSCIGFAGFYAGPDVHLVDGYALADPLLSRLPTYKKRDWRIGHFSRALPWSYWNGIKEGENLISDSGLALFYDQILLITRGEIFDPQRWVAMWKMNTGQFDSLVDKYVNPPQLVRRYEEVNSLKPEGTVWNEDGNFIIRQTGIHILLDSTYQNKELEISVDHNDYYEVSFYMDSTELGYVKIDKLHNEVGGLRVDTLEVPLYASLGGYNSIVVAPLAGDDLYSMGHLRLLE